MENLKFKVDKSIRLETDWNIEDMLKYPVHEHSIYELQEIIISYEYKATSKFDKDKFIEFMINYLKKKYHTNSVILINR